jgi:hypothetical protein
MREPIEYQTMNIIIKVLNESFLEFERTKNKTS